MSTVDGAQGRGAGGLGRNYPGTRPPIWWRLDAPEPRQEGESEVAYLRRLRLLLRGEERRLPADAFEPEEVQARS